MKKYEDTLAQIIENLHPDHKNENSTLHAEWMKSKGHRNIAARGQSKDYAHEVIEFEKNLAAASPNAEDRDDVTVCLYCSYGLNELLNIVQKYYNPMSLKDADSLTPQIHLASIIKSLAPSDFKTNRLIVMSPDYMRNLSSILSSTSKEVLQTYFMWKVVQAYSSAIEADELKPYSKFTNELQGKVMSVLMWETMRRNSNKVQDPESSPERWRTCVGHVDGGLGWILSRFFVEKAFSEKAKNFGDQIVSDIKDMFIEKLKVTTWMDKSVVQLAIEKVHKIVQKIGYPTKVGILEVDLVRPRLRTNPSIESEYHGPTKSSRLLSLR